MSVNVRVQGNSGSHASGHVRSAFDPKSDIGRSIFARSNAVSAPIELYDFAVMMPPPEVEVRMKRRSFIGLVGGVAASWPLTTRAGSVPRVGYIEGSRRAPYMDDFVSALGELGYVDGRNIVFVRRRFAAPTVQAMQDAIAEMQSDIDLLVVGGTVGGVAAKSAAAHIPVVFISVGAPVDIGLVESLAHPGGNMTGTTFEATSETYAKRLPVPKRNTA